MDIKAKQSITLGCGTFTVVKLLGKGKSGYSWLIENTAASLVLKLIHNEPCHYYQFGDKLAAELNAYGKLAPHIKIPRLMESNPQEKYLVKEYFPGPTVAELVASNALPETTFEQIFDMCRKLYASGMNIDYFPTNFIWSGKELVYVDYEFNTYTEEWDFEHWGIYYWLNSAGMKEFLSTSDPRAINIDGTGKPVQLPFEEEARSVIEKHSGGHDILSA